MEAAYRELQGFVRRAKTTPDRTGTLRRSALRQLIEAATQVHPPSSSTNSNSSVQTKIFAAVNIPEFFQDFPEVEEDAINAVYDLCEDQSRQVRMEGYRTLASISKIEKKWVKRNADVLVQLLQSDEANEVNVVRKALIEHLHMDARVTLGVLCDQIVPAQTTTSTSARPGVTTSRVDSEQEPAEEDYTEEDLSIRDNLRTLVLAFIVGELRKGTGGLGRYMPPGSEAESVLVDGLIGALPRLGDADVHIILKDILLQLPGPFLDVVPPTSSSSAFHPSPSSKSKSTSSSSPQGNKTRTRRSNLAEIVLYKARAALSDDLSKDGTGPTRLTKSRPYFDALNVLFLIRGSNSTNGQSKGEEGSPNPTDLLTFYSRLLPKSVLSSIEEVDQGIVIWRFSETLNAYFQHDVGEKDTKGDGESIRRLLNNLLPWVFEWFSNTDLMSKEHEQTHLQEACVVLLERAFLMRTIDGVTISSLMIKSIRTLGDKITTLVNGAANGEGKMKKIQDLIKSLTDKTTFVDVSKSYISQSTASSTSKPLMSIPLSRTSSLPISLSTSVSTSSPSPNPYSNPNAPNFNYNSTAGPSNANANAGGRVQSIPGSPLGQGLRRKQPSDSQDSHQAKKVKKSGGGGPNSERPSLLSRLGNTGSFESYSPYPNQSQTRTPSQRRTSGDYPTTNAASNGNDAWGGGSLGLSIKGAANAAAVNSTRTKNMKRKHDIDINMDADSDFSSSRAQRYPEAVGEHGSQTLIHRLGNGESGPSLGSRLGRGRGRGRGSGVGGAVGEVVHDAHMLGKDSGSVNGGNGRNSKKRNGY